MRKMILGFLESLGKTDNPPRVDPEDLMVELEKTVSGLPDPKKREFMDNLVEITINDAADGGKCMGVLTYLVIAGHQEVIRHHTSNFFELLEDDRLCHFWFDSESPKLDNSRQDWHYLLGLVTLLRYLDADVSEVVARIQTQSSNKDLNRALRIIYGSNSTRSPFSGSTQED